MILRGVFFSFRVCIFSVTIINSNMEGVKTMDTIFSSINFAEIIPYLRSYMVPFFLILAATALIWVSRWRIFKKLGLPGIKGIIPIYGDYTLFKNRWKKKYFWILTASTVVYYGGSVLISYLMMRHLPGGVFFGTVEQLKALMMPYLIANGILAIMYLIVSLAITIGLNIKVAEPFEEGVGFALGMTVLPFLFYPILAFSKSSSARKKRPLQLASTVLTLAFVFGIVTCAPFSVGAAETDYVAATAAEPEDLFGTLSEGRYTLQSLTYELPGDYVLGDSLALLQEPHNARLLGKRQNGRDHIQQRLSDRPYPRHPGERTARELHFDYHGGSIDRQRHLQPDELL